MPDQSENDRRQIGARLRETREYLDLSQDEVAKFMKMPRSAISLIESGERRVDAVELKRFAELYQQPLSHFIDGPKQDAVPADVAHLARTATQLTPKDREELIRFARFLKSRPNPS